METTSKIACNILVDVLAAQGIRKFVVSPGSRNAPIIVALSRRDDVVKHVIVDERSAAFVALGIAQQSGEAVGIVCTSGTALLNYAPAVAEAYYQKLPLIVISADRPREWIDQDDSQTIRQYEALSQFVKKSYDLPARCDDATAQWYVNRMVNDAVIEATGGQPAPVHINLQLDEPLGCFADYKEGGERVIESVQPPASLSTATITLLEKIASGKKVLVIAGFGKENPALSKAVEAFRETTGAVVLTETIANIRSDNAVRAIDRTLLAMDKEDEYVPDVLITLGGALVSRMIKVLMRRHRPAEHWHIGVTSTTVDCMQSLTKRIQVDPVAFFNAFRPIANRNYAMLWDSLALLGKVRQNAYLQTAPWSDIKAFSILLPTLPADWCLQLSNGTTIRYAQLFGDEIACRSYCNRGVSGIDGSTSTAVGASLAYKGATLLITGDMSFSYDLSGLANAHLGNNLKIVVIDNGGGGIFRFVKSTASLPELEDYLEVHRQVPVKEYAAAFGFTYFEASDETSLRQVLPIFLTSSSKPAILAIRTDHLESAETLKRYFEI